MNDTLKVVLDERDAAREQVAQAAAAQADGDAGVDDARGTADGTGVQAKGGDVMADKDIRIVVLQRGWVIVGEYSREGMDCRVRRASVIRRWGTTKGLGELRSGPLRDTVLDPIGEAEHHRVTEVLTIRCDADGWEGHLVD